MNELVVSARRNLDRPVPVPARPAALELPVAPARVPAAQDAAVGGIAPALRGGAMSIDFESVYVEYFHHVSRWSRALGGLEADLDDLTQEVFMVVRRKLTTFDGPSLPAWLYGITRKTVSDYRRRAFVRRLLSGASRSLDGAEPDHEPSLQPLERWEARRILRRVLGRMSNVRRTAFILFEVEGYSGEEIAQLEQIPLATVYTRLHHARKDFLRLTAEITGDEPEEPPP